MVTIERHMAAMDKLVSLVSVRERYRAEARARLLKAGFNEEEADDAVESAIRCGIIDDNRYACAYVRGKVSKGWGRAKILRSLEMDGVEADAIEVAKVYLADPDQEYLNALRALEKKSCTSKNPRASLMRRLVNKGFSFEVAKSAVDDFLSQEV